MNFRLTILLLGCSLSAYGQEAKPAGASAPSSDTRAAKAKSFTPKLEWNLEPAHWEEIVGISPAASAASARQISVVSLESFASIFDSAPGAGASAGGAVSSDQIERALRKTEAHEGLPLGKSDYVIRSPILEGMIPQRTSTDASLGRKILNLPVVRWFVPKPMPQPLGGGKYFLWGEREEPWSNLGRPTPGPCALDNGM